MKTKEKFILIGFQNDPLSQPKILKEFFNGSENMNVSAIRAMAGFTSSHLKIKYFEGLENAIIFTDENEAGLVQQALSRSFHGRYNFWCVREMKENSTIKEFMINFLKINSHLSNYKTALKKLVEQY